MEEVGFDIIVRVVARPVAGWPGPLECPACQCPLRVHQPEEDAPHRLLASCGCEECGIWYAVVPSVDRARVYLIRIPAIAEMREVLGRHSLA